MTAKLTLRKQQFLDIIKKKIADYVYPPTLVEIARKLGFRAPNATEDHLKALTRKGVIELIAGTSRGIRLTQQSQETVSSTPSSEQATESPSADTLNLAVIGRVAAGSPVLASEHIEKEQIGRAHV